MTVRVFQQSLRDRLTNRRVRIRDINVQNTGGQEIVNNAIGNKGVAAWRSVPEPDETVESLYQTVHALKEGYEALQRIRGKTGNSAVTVDELADSLELLKDFILDETDKRYTPL